MCWLDDLRQRLEREAELTPDCVVSLIASEWGGERVYVPRRAHRRLEIAPSDTPQTIARKHGVARRTAYRWVNGWKR